MSSYIYRRSREASYSVARDAEHRNVDSSQNLENHKTCEFTGMPVNMITALWQMAEKRKDYVVLSDMLKFDYLPEYCLKQARNIKDFAVRCAYLLRPETTNRKELLNLENRSSVFAAIS